MKKVFLCLLSMICFGCAQLHNISRPSETIPNPKCEENVGALQVFQVLDKFVLTRSCEDSSDTYCSWLVVYLEKEKDKIYYDDQKIVPASNQCFSYVGTYKYETKDKTTKVVPKAKLVSSTIANPEYEIWKKEQQDKTTK